MMDIKRYTMSSNLSWLGGHLLRGEDTSGGQKQDTNNNGDDEDLTSTLLLPDLHGKSDILKTMHIRELSNFMPARAEGYAWTLAFSTTTMGFSLKSLYRSLSRYEGPVLLIIRDSAQRVFGAFSSCTLNPSDSFYGTGETYLFTFKQAAQSQVASKAASAAAVALEATTTPTTQAPMQASSSSTTAGLEDSAGGGGKLNSAIGNQNNINKQTTQFIRFSWTGDNLYFIKGNTDSLAFGAGEGKYGLWLDEDLYHGSSHSCKTFNNDPLSDQEDFVVCTLECWVFL